MSLRKTKNNYNHLRDKDEVVKYEPTRKEGKFEQKYKYHEKKANINWIKFQQVQNQIDYHEKEAKLRHELKLQ